MSNRRVILGRDTLTSYQNAVLKSQISGNWAFHHRIASTNQRTISTATKQITARGVRVGCMVLEKQRGK